MMQCDEAFFYLTWEMQSQRTRAFKNIPPTAPR